MPCPALTIPALVASSLALQACATCQPARDEPIDTTAATPAQQPRLEPAAHQRDEPVDEPVTLTRGPITTVFTPRIDRLTSFKKQGGPEMLFTQKLDAEPLPDEAYTFYGGAYTWTAPQNGAPGWVGPEGEPRAWPPDPAMNVGPATVTDRTEHAVSTRTPTSRLGFVEDKTFALTEQGMDLTYRLVNEGGSTRAAGTWINTAVHDDAVLAVRLVGPDALANLRGWDTRSIDRFVSIASRQGDGWALIDLSKAEWQGGIKVYVPRVVGELPTIAVWREGQWLLRAQRITESATNTAGRLRALGEGAVAVYIQPEAGEDATIVEAELYGPIVDIAPGTVHEASETWRLIDSSDGPDTSLLPVFQDPAENTAPRRGNGGNTGGNGNGNGNRNGQPDG